LKQPSSPPALSVWAVATLGALTALSATAIDISIPAQPDIAATLGAEPAAGAALVGVYLATYGPGQMLWGPLSDRYGRRLPLYVSLVGFLAASVLCAFAADFELLIWARALQGFLGGAPPVIARAIARDQGGGPRTAGLISTMTIILGLAPLAAPALGSLLVAVLDWRAIFGFLAVLAGLLIAGSLVSLPRDPPPAADRPGPGAYLRSVLPVLGAADFLFGTLLSSAIFCGYAAFLSSGTLVARDLYGVSAEAFGPLFAIAAAAFMLGSALARLIQRRAGMHRLLPIGVACALGAGTGLLLTLGGEAPGLVGLWALISLYVLAFGLLLPSATALALEPAGRAAGAASSLIGAVQVCLGAVGSWLSAVLSPDPYRGLVLIMAGSAAVALAAYVLWLARRT